MECPSHVSAVRTRCTVFSLTAALFGVPSEIPSADTLPDPAARHPGPGPWRQAVPALGQAPQRHSRHVHHSVSDFLRSTRDPGRLWGLGWILIL